MDETLFRRAVAEDLPQVVDVWYENEAEAEPDPPPRPNDPALFAHDLTTGDMYVAESKGRVVAFGSSVVRGRVRFLTNLFVRAERQGSGIGRKLLGMAMPDDGLVHATLTSSDPRAHALYVRAGMQPRWPHYLLQASSDAVEQSEAGIEAVQASPGDPRLVEMDAEIGGRPRPRDHANWIEWLQAVPMWFQRDGETVGYGYVQLRNPYALHHAEAAHVGPVGALRNEDSPACVAAAVSWASARFPTVALGVPGLHPALPGLLSGGFRIHYVETFVCSEEKEFADPRRYVPSGSELF